jgi:hypothetical protein
MANRNQTFTIAAMTSRRQQTIGLVLIALFILILILVRTGKSVYWGWR